MIFLLFFVSLGVSLFAFKKTYLYFLLFPTALFFDFYFLKPVGFSGLMMVIFAVVIQIVFSSIKIESKYKI